MRDLTKEEQAILETSAVRRVQIPFEKLSQVAPFDDQIVIEEVPEESPLAKPAKPGKIIVAGRGTARNPKRNLDSNVLFLVRKVGKNVTKVAPGDWVMLNSRAMNGDNPEAIVVFFIEEGAFAWCVEGSIAGVVRPLEEPS